MEGRQTQLPHHYWKYHVLSTRYQTRSDLGTTGSGEDGGGRDLLRDGRQSDAEGTADRIDGWTGRGSQFGAPAVLLDLELAQVSEIIDDMKPLQVLVIACSYTHLTLP